MPGNPLLKDEPDCRGGPKLGFMRGRLCIERGKLLRYLPKIPRFWFTAMVSLWAIAGSGAHGEAQLGKRELVLQRLSQDDLRVGSLGFRLTTANAKRCAKQVPATGLILHSIDQFHGAWRDAAVRLYGPIGGVSVAGVVGHSPSALAGIEPGDELIAVNGKRLDPAEIKGSGSTTRRDQAEEALISLPPQDAIQISVVRAGKARDFVLRPVPACRARFEVVSGSARFARTDGRLVQLGQALVGSLSDEDIAFVLSHELAHSILEHRAQLAPWEQQGRSWVAAKKRFELAREFEDQADRLSVRLLAAAGFDPWAAPRFMRRFGKGFDRPASGSRVHRPAPERAKLMELEIARLASDLAQ